MKQKSNQRTGKRKIYGDCQSEAEQNLILLWRHRLVDDDLYNIMADDYSKLEGYNPDADLGLGCGLPTEFARLKKVIRLSILAVAPVMMLLLRETL